MGRYLCGPSVLRDARGKAIGIPGLEFAHLFQPAHETALIAAGAVTRVTDDPEVYRQEWIAAGLIEPDPEPDPAVEEPAADAASDEEE